MNYIRAIAAVILGYLLFAFADMYLVLALFDRGISSSPLLQQPMGGVGLLIIGLLVGFATGKIAGKYRRVSTGIVVLLIGAVTVLNIILDQAIEPLWFKILVLVICAPAAAWSMRKS